MIPSFELINKILKSLPISYYLKRKANVSLSREIKKSQIDLMTDTIIISYSQISKYDIPSDLENHIRALLYHEVSHAMLSPIPKYFNIDKDIYNIVEDERIETINANTFLDTDFKKTLSIISPLTLSLEPKTNFFNLVRYRIGTEEEIKLVECLIKKHSYLRYSPKPQNIDEYLEDIKKLYAICDITSPFYQTKDCKQWIQSMLLCQNSEEDKEGKDEHLNTDVFNYYDNPQFYQKMQSILHSTKLTKGMNASSRPSYSGKIRPKSINKPNDNYKWWTRPGDGFLKNAKKLYLNLFIDQSGSFKPNEDKINSILKELYRIEKTTPNFKVNLITIDTDINISKDRKINCSGANSLTSKIKHITKQIIKPSNKNINIIMLDGIAIDKDVIDPITNQLLPKYSQAQYENFKYFNLPNTIIISNNSNKVYLERYCYSTKIIYTSKYLEELEDNILKSFKSLITE